MTADLALLGRVAAAFERVDGVPPDVRRNAELAASRSRRSIGRPLALLRDSAAVRGPGGGRLLRFGAAGLRVEVDVEGGGSVRLTGLLHATAPGWVVTACWPAGELPIGVDHLGRFAAEDLPPGPLCLALHHPLEPDAGTPWFVG